MSKERYPFFNPSPILTRGACVVIETYGSWVLMVFNLSAMVLAGKKLMVVLACCCCW